MKAINKRFLKFLNEARNTSPRIHTLEPLVFRDPTDDGPEVAILRGDKIIVRQGDEFILAHPFPAPRIRSRWIV